jgi:hypothetical protein
MAFSNKADLKASVTTWLTRTDMGGFADDFITLAEARLNRELDPVETAATITGTPSSRSISVSAQSVEEPLALFLADPVLGDEREVLKKSANTFPFITEPGSPWVWSLDGTNIVFDRPVDQAYSFRFRFTQRFNLVADSDTNWLLTYHPDIYLAATLIWGNILKRASDEAVPFVAVLQEGLPAVKRQLAQQKRGTLTVDPALAAIGRNYYWELS